MRVTVVTEHRFRRGNAGVVTGGPFPYSFWKRYLTVFDGVQVVARVSDSGAGSRPAARADGPGVSFASLPYYIGPEHFFLRAPHVRRVLLSALGAGDAIILRLPSVLAYLAEGWLRRAGRPYAVEVVGDPWDALARGAYRHPLRGLFRWILAGSQRRLSATSCASLYVTRQALQRRYPPRLGAFSVGCSDVELPRSAFVEEPRPPRIVARPLVLVTVGSLDHLYKAPDILLEAVARCLRDGFDLNLAIVGDGRHRRALEARSAQLGISNRISFRGHRAFGEAVRRELDRADLFVLPSRQEGLPRALLEAMARALPAIGSTVGGFPELLAPEDLARPNDAADLARKIEAMVTDPSRLGRMSERSLTKAREYEESRLEHKRNLFLERVHIETGNWLRGRGGARLAAGSAG